MYKLLLSLPIVGMLLSGAQIASTDSSFEEKPQALITKTFPGYGFSDEGYKQLQYLAEYSDKGLENAASVSFDVSSFEHIGNIPALTLKELDVHFELEINGRMDLSSVQSKEKKRVTMKKFKQVWIFDHYFKGDVKFTPEVYLLVKTPQMQQLVDRIKIPLNQYSVYIENIEPAESFEISGLIALEKVEGITDRLNELMEDISLDIETELESILTGASLDSINSKINTLKNN